MQRPLKAAVGTAWCEFDAGWSWLIRQDAGEEKTASVTLFSTVLDPGQV